MMDLFVGVKLAHLQGQRVRRRRTAATLTMLTPNKASEAGSGTWVGDTLDRSATFTYAPLDRLGVTLNWKASEKDVVPGKNPPDSKKSSVPEAYASTPPNNPPKE